MSNNKTQALVICGHGSSLDLYKKDFEIAKKKIQKEIQIDCFDCFIEKDKPSINDCLSQLKKKGYEKIFFFPSLFLKENIMKKISKKKLNLLQMVHKKLFY